MSSSGSTDESSVDSEQSDYDLEVEGAGDDIDNNASEALLEEPDLSKFAYSEEPIADEEWVADYYKKQKEIEELEEQLTKRLNGTTPTSEWCKCGRCDPSYGQNISECYCCSELDECVESLTSEQVVQDVGENTVLVCVTDHPGFNQVCLQKWSLRLAADKYKKKNKETYKQTGSEESFLRSVAYREFTRLIYGFLGQKKRYPLPSCAYSAIRKTFKDGEFAGFELEDAM